MTFGAYVYFATDVILHLDGRLNEIFPFWLYLVISSALVYTLILHNTLIKNQKIPLVFCFYLVYVSIVIISFVFSNYTDFSSKQLTLFLLYGPTSFYAGTILYRYIDGNKLRPYLYALIIIASYSTLLSLRAMVGKSVVDLMDFFGGGQYQSYSHFAAISFLMCIGLSVADDNLTLIKKFTLFISCALLLLGVILSGGRAGAVMIVCGSIYFLIKHKLYKKFLKLLLILGFAAIIICFMTIYDLQNVITEERIIQSIERLTSYIGSDGIDIDGTSNRDAFYLKAFELIANRPFFGYGFFGSSEYVDQYYPHNIILEILVHGGLNYFLLTALIFFYLVKKFHKIEKDHNSFELIISACLYSFTVLLVSSSYLIEPLFWLVIGYMMSNFVNIKSISPTK